MLDYILCPASSASQSPIQLGIWQISFCCCQIVMATHRLKYIEWIKFHSKMLPSYHWLVCVGMRFNVLFPEIFFFGNIHQCEIHMNSLRKIEFLSWIYNFRTYFINDFSLVCVCVYAVRPIYQTRWIVHFTVGNRGEWFILLGTHSHGISTVTQFGSIGSRFNLHKFSRSLHQLILFIFNSHHANTCTDYYDEDWGSLMHMPTEYFSFFLCSCWTIVKFSNGISDSFWDWWISEDFLEQEQEKFVWASVCISIVSSVHSNSKDFQMNNCEQIDANMKLFYCSHSPHSNINIKNKR